MKFKIEKEIEEEKINKLIKFPKSLIIKIEKEAKKNNISTTKFINLAVEYAINNIEEENKKESRNLS